MSNLREKNIGLNSGLVLIVDWS